MTSEDIGNSAVAEAPAFNAAVDTLMRLSTILKYIAATCLIEASDRPNELRRDMASMQHRKLSLVKSFFIQSCPLITDKDIRDEFSARIKEMTPFWVGNSDERKTGGRSKILTNLNEDTHSVPFYSYVLERGMDNLLIDIQLVLQEGGYYMPPPKEKLG